MLGGTWSFGAASGVGFGGIGLTGGSTDGTVGAGFRMIASALASRGGLGGLDNALGAFLTFIAACLVGVGTAGGCDLGFLGGGAPVVFHRVSCGFVVALAGVW